jgi:head-tail adaptor
MDRIGELRQRADFEGVVRTADEDGSYTETRTTLYRGVAVSITVASVRDLERLGAGTVTAMATYIVRARYHRNVTTQTQIRWNGRVFQVTGGDFNVKMLNDSMELVCVEMVE